MQQEAKRSAAVHTLAARPEFYRHHREDSQARTRDQCAGVEHRKGQARAGRNDGCTARCGCVSHDAAEALRRLRIRTRRACADRLRTRPRLRLDRMVRHARGLLRLDDGILPARSAAGGLGQYRQSARGLLSPTPKVEVVDGGIKISGSWPWASGIDSATWLILAAMIPNKDGPPDLAWCLVPVRDVIVDHDSWNVSGLQGTGSKTVHDQPNRVFVPRHRILPLGAVFSGKVPGLEIPDNDQARFGYPDLRPDRAWFRRSSAWRRARSMPSPKPPGTPSAWRRPGVFEKVAELPLIQSLIGRTAARIDAARTLMVTSLSEGQEVVRAGGTLEIEQRVRIRRNHGFAAQNLVRSRERESCKIRSRRRRRKESRSALLARCQRGCAACEPRLGHAVGALRHAATRAAAARRVLGAFASRPGDCPAPDCRA